MYQLHNVIHDIQYVQPHDFTLLNHFCNRDYVPNATSAQTLSLVPTPSVPDTSSGSL